MVYLFNACMCIWRHLHVSFHRWRRSMAVMLWRSFATQRALRKMSFCCPYAKLSSPSSYTMETCTTSGENNLQTCTPIYPGLVVKWGNVLYFFYFAWYPLNLNRCCLIKACKRRLWPVLPLAGTWCSSGAGCTLGPIPPHVVSWPSVCSWPLLPLTSEPSSPSSNWSPQRCGQRHSIFIFHVVS